MTFLSSNSSQVSALVDSLLSSIITLHAKGELSNAPKEKEEKENFLFAVDHCFAIKGQGI